MRLRDNQLEVLWIAREDYEENSGVKLHKHDFYQLLLVIEGEGEIEIDGKLYPVLPNHIYLFKKGVAHRFQYRKETVTLDKRKLNVYYSRGKIPKADLELAGTPYWSKSTVEEYCLQEKNRLNKD